MWKFWDIQQNIFDPIGPVVKLQKNRNLESEVVSLCWILLHKNPKCWSVSVVQLLQVAMQTRQLSKLLFVPRVCTCFGSRSFAVSVPTIWNSLPLALAVVSPLTVFGANSKLSSITLLSGLLNAPLHPAPQIRRVSHWHCALYNFTYLLTTR